MDGTDLMKAAVAAALVLVVGAYFVVASAQARSPVQQCFDARMAYEETRSRYLDAEAERRKALESVFWAACIGGTGGQ